MPQYRPCLLVWCLTTDNCYWCGASLSAMPAGVLPHYRSYLLAWCLIPYLLVYCLTIDHAFQRGASSSTMPVGVVPHYRPCLLAWFLTIGHAFWSIATAINILLVECRWKNGGYKSGATCTGFIISGMHDNPVPLSDMPAFTIQLYQICVLGS